MTCIGEPPNDASPDGIKRLRHWQKGEFQLTNYQPVEFGNNNIIREKASIDMGITKATSLGDNNYIHSGVSIHHDTCLESSVVVGPNACICGSVRLMDSCQIGAGAIVHQRRIVGSYSMIGMGAVITKDIPPFLMAYGVPCEIRGLNERKIATLVDTNQHKEVLFSYLHECMSTETLDESFITRLPEELGSELARFRRLAED